MKRKLKIISVIALILAIAISFTSSCFATETNEDIISSTNAKSYYEVAMEYAENNGYDVVDYLICSDGHVYLFTKGYTCYVEGDLIFAEKAYIFEFKGEPVSGTAPIIKNSSGRYTFSSNIIFSSFDVMLMGNEELVFQRTPVEGNLSTTLAPIVQEAPLEETMTEIVKILPIILIILVGLIGLRKGLALLSQTLQKA